MLPFSVLILDPVVRSFKELGRLFLLTRVLVLLSLVAVLYFGLDHFGLTGMITAAVGAIVAEKLIAEVMVINKLGLGLKHLRLLTNTGKTAIISLFAGLVTYIVYTNVHLYLLNIGQRFAEQAFSTTKLSTINFIGGSLVLLFSAMVFVPIYLLAANFWGVIEDEEKQTVRNFLAVFCQTRCSTADGYLNMLRTEPSFATKLKWNLPWLVRYPWSHTRSFLEQTAFEKKHIIFTVANHFEPAWAENGVLDHKTQLKRLECITSSPARSAMRFGT